MFQGQKFLRPLHVFIEGRVNKMTIVTLESSVFIMFVLKYIAPVRLTVIAQCTGHRGTA